MVLKTDVNVVIDMKGLKEIRRKLIQAASLHVKVGFLDGKPHPNSPGDTVATIAAIQEFGLPSQNIPERPFMAATVRSTKVDDALAVSVKRYLAGTETAKGVLTGAGIKMAAEMSSVISDFSSPANAPLTISLKGFDDPLVETGHMRDNVDFRVGSNLARKT